MALRLATVRETSAAKAASADEVREAIEFRVDATREHGTLRVCPVGELDLATIGGLREQLDEAMVAGAGTVILDLRKTTFVDSSVLHLAVETYERAGRDGIGFAIIAGPRAVERAFTLSGLRDRLPFVDVPRG
jgi:anti-anti-sigma factor